MERKNIDQQTEDYLIQTKPAVNVLKEIMESEPEDGPLHSVYSRLLHLEAEEALRTGTITITLRPKGDDALPAAELRWGKEGQLRRFEKANVTQAVGLKKESLGELGSKLVLNGREVFRIELLNGVDEYPDDVDELHT